MYAIYYLLSKILSKCNKHKESSHHKYTAPWISTKHTLPSQDIEYFCTLEASFISLSSLTPTKGNHCSDFNHYNEFGPVFELDIIGTRQHVLFCIWHIFFNIVSRRFIHAGMDQKRSFIFVTMWCWGARISCPLQGSF